MFKGIKITKYLVRRRDIEKKIFTNSTTSFHPVIKTDVFLFRNLPLVEHMYLRFREHGFPIILSAINVPQFPRITAVDLAINERYALIR